MGGADRQARGVCGRAERLDRPPAGKRWAHPRQGTGRPSGAEVLPHWRRPQRQRPGCFQRIPVFFVIPRGGAGGAKACSGEGPGTGLFVRGPAFRAVSPPVPSPTAAKKPAAPLACGFLVPVTGIEPVRCFHRQILSLLRLPISPHRQILAHLVYHSPQENAREAQRNQAALGNMIQLWGAAPSRPKSRLQIALGRCAPEPLRDFPPRESHQSAPGALPVRAGSPRTPVCPKDEANRPRRRVPRRGHVG